MKNHVNISTLLAIMLLNSVIVFGQSQTYLSEYWTGQGGEMAVFYQNVTKTDAQRNVYVVGSTLNTSNNNDIILQKFNRNGDLLWEQTFNGAANMDDMAADMFVDNSMNIYVTGTSVSSANSSFDLVVLKYNSNGQLQWTQYYDNGGSPDPYDAGTSIIGDNNGSIFVTGGSFGSNTLSDYVTLRLNTSNGNIIWSQRYDYVQLNDLASKIHISGNQVVVSGGSQITLVPNRYELATLIYDKNSGALLSTRRSSGSATSGTDEIYDVTVDNSGNFYLTGSVVNSSTGHDLAVYKLDDELNIVWQQTWDGYGNDDKGQGIKLDSQGNVYVAGYTQSTSEGDNFAILKYSNSGSLIWNREYNGEANLNDRARQLVIDGNDRLYVTGEARNSSQSDYQTVGYTADGDIFAQTSFDGPEGLDDKPSAIALDLDGNLIVVGQSQTQSGWKNYTVKYAKFERLRVPSGGADNHLKNEILVKFSPALVDPTFVDNKAETFRIITDAIPDSIASKMELLTGVPFTDKRSVNAIKVFPNFTRADSISISRQGTDVPIPKFWSTFLLNIPGDDDLQEVCDSLNTLQPEVFYAELNHLYEIDDIPDDDDYSTQLSLQQNNVSINAENAWNVEKGKTVVKVGIYDTGIDYEHPDFSWDGTNTFNGSVVKGGKDYSVSGFPLIQNISDADGNGHGTSAGSIIGAIRNNTDFIAGIAGGDSDDDIEGVSLYAMKINPGSTGNIDIAAAAAAINDGASSTGYGLHVLNNSWSGPNVNMTLRNAVEFCWRNGATFVASRGNRSANQSPSIETQPRYPACYNDFWVLNVGASGTDELTPGVGSRKVTNNGDPFNPSDHGYGSYYGQGMDVIAPGTIALVRSLITGNYSTSGVFNGTSASAPHAAGTAALLMSKQNEFEEGNPVNLAPEDVEFLIQKYATPITVDGAGPTSGLPVPNDFAGHGRVNAEQTLNMLDYPEYQVKHYGNPGLSIEVNGSNQQVFLSENINGVAAGAYNAVARTFIHMYQISLPTGQSIIDWRPRFSGTIGVGNYTAIDGQTFAEFDVVSQSSNSIDINVTTYSWLITTPLGSGAQINTWIPAPPSQIKSGFSLHIHDALATSTEDLRAENRLMIFPNPALNELTVNIKLIKPSRISYRIVDIQGRIVMQDNLGIKSSGENRLNILLDDLVAGMYVCVIETDVESFSEKFIKQ